jgi:tetratricopeptide (TPR) repeat protein
MNSLRLYLFFFLFVSGFFLPEAKGEVSAGKTDSLISQLSGMEDGEKKIQLLNDLALLFRESDPDKALIYSRQALSMATQLQSISSCAVTNKVMGEIFEFKHNYQPSINYYLISIKHYKTLGDKNELALLYNKLGHIYITNHYDYDQGMVYFNQALENAESVGNSKEMATSYNSIGGIYYYQNDLDKANIYFRDALKIREEIGDESGIAASLNNIGEIHRLKGDFNKALDFYNQAIKINETIRHKHYLSINYLNMGLIFSTKGDPVKAKNYFLKSIDLNIQSRDTASVISGMIELGKHYNKQLDFDSSLQTFAEALELAIKYNDLNGQKDASYGMSIAYDGKGDTRKAFEKFKLYTALHDSLFVKAKADQLDELHSRFALNLKEKEIELKDNEIALLQREQKIFHFRQLLLFLSLFLVIIITILVYSNLQSKHKKNKLLMEQEAALSKAKHELMEIELRNKTHDLTNVALHLVEKNKFLHELKSELKSLRNAPVEQREERIKELAINVQQNINLQKDLDDFQSHINEVNTAFYRKLKARFPGLTKNEEHLCAMLRLNLSSKEIAALNNISLRAVEMGRYRLRKKFDIPSSYSISDFLQEL